MRFATWNINGLRARLDFLLHWLDARQPDVVGLQELKLTDEDFPHDALLKAGYVAVTHGQKSWNGVAILSRNEVTDVRRGLPGQEEAGSRLVEAVASDIRFITLYCPNGKSLEHEDYERKLNWFESLLGYLQETHHPDRPAILCGDFNICPQALDSWNEGKLGGRIFHTKRERDLIQALLAWGLEDLYRKLYPDAQTFSWWDYRGGAFHRKQGLRIDFLLGTAAVSARLQDAVVDRDYRKKKEGLTASDHAPVYVDLDV